MAGRFAQLALGLPASYPLNSPVESVSNQRTM